MGERTRLCSGGHRHGGGRLHALPAYVLLVLCTGACPPPVGSRWCSALSLPRSTHTAPSASFPSPLLPRTLCRLRSRLRTARFLSPLSPITTAQRWISSQPLYHRQGWCLGAPTLPRPPRVPAVRCRAGHCRQRCRQPCAWRQARRLPPPAMVVRVTLPTKVMVISCVAAWSGSCF